MKFIAPEMLVPRTKVHGVSAHPSISMDRGGLPTAVEVNLQLKREDRKIQCDSNL